MSQVWNPFSGVPNASAVGDTGAEGSSPLVARMDHTHGREAYGTPVAATPDASPGAGSGTDVVRANHQHGFATASATPAAIGATGSAGTSATAPSRGDHIHAMGILTARGDVLTRNASAFIRLPLGSNGQVLQSDGTDLVFSGVPAPAFLAVFKWAVD